MGFDLTTEICSRDLETSAQGNVMDLCRCCNYWCRLYTGRDGSNRLSLNALISRSSVRRISTISPKSPSAATKSHFGVCSPALVNFLLVAAAVYFFIVTPMNKLIAMRVSSEDEEETPEEIALLRNSRCFDKSATRLKLLTRKDTSARSAHRRADVSSP